MKSDLVRLSVEKYRARMRRAGFRLVQLWVPDTRAPRFAAECRRQSKLAARHPHEAEILTEIESLQDDGGWTA